MKRRRVRPAPPTARSKPLVTVPVHFDDYGVFRSPRSDFELEWARRTMPGTLRLVERGDVVPLAD